MIVILQGIRAGTLEPLVLVRCPRCVQSWLIAGWVALLPEIGCSCGFSAPVKWQPTLAEALATSPRTGVAFGGDRGAASAAEAALTGRELEAATRSGADGSGGC